MLEQLFGSKTRLKLLRVFFHHFEKKFFVRELTRMLDSQINAVRRELDLLLEVGIIMEVQVENGTKEEQQKRYYTLDQSSLLFPELQALLIKAQMLGEQKFIEELKERGGEIKLMLLTGRFTGEKKAPSDILIVGDLRPKALENLITRQEKESGFEIRYTLMDEKEFFERRQMMDKFLFSLFEGNCCKVINEWKV